MLARFFSHGSNTLLVAGVAALAGCFASGAVSLHWFEALLGALVFFTSEYTTHRFLFHAPPMKQRTILALQHRLHYDHHVDPNRLDLLFLPPWFTIPTTALFFAVYFALTRDLGAALSLTFGSLTGLTYYEWVHYVAHIPFNPVTPYGRWIKKYHLWHHFKNEHLWFGVTNPSMDVVMASYRDVQETARSATVREIWRG